MADDSLRILIAEDEQAHAEAIRRSFQTAGLNAEVLVAGTLQEYREITAAQPPDIALLDLNLPDGRAVEVLTSPAEAGPFPVLIMTSFGNEKIAVEAMKAGALDYIVKSPEAFSEMPRLVERALREWRLLQERKQADGALRVLLERYRQLVENAKEAIVVAQGGWLKFVNPMACEITGYSEEELASLPFVDLVHPNDREMVVSLYLKRLKGDPLLDRYVFRILTKGGAIKWVEIGAALIEWEDQPATLNLLTDITERKEAEEALWKSRSMLKNILDMVPQAIFWKDSASVYLGCNKVFADAVGIEDHDLIVGKTDFDLPWTREEAEAYRADDQEVIIKGKSKRHIIEPLQRVDGERLWVDTTKVQLIDETGKVFGILGVYDDISEHKRAVEALQDSESFLNSIIDQSPYPMWISDAQGTLIRLNQACRDLLNISEEDVVGKYNVLKDNIVEEQGFLPLIKRVFEEGERARFEIRYDSSQLKHLRLRHFAFVILDVSVFPIRDASGRITNAVIQHMNLTERKWAEEALRESEEKYRTLFEDAIEGIFRTTPEGRFLIANPALAQIYGYDSPEEMIESITDLAGQVYADPEERQAFTRAMEEEGEVKGYELQLKRKDGSILWVSMNARVVRDEAGKILYYEGLAEDITPRKKSEENLLESLESLRKAVGTTIQVMVSAVETRDPYTAGHQKRVTDLARTLAQELGLAQDAVEGIRMAGSIHDLGKISVPAEILNKPTKLTEIEFALIKAHSQYGYEILKDVESPWPLADMVLQHHERMDGSGYPQGLKGEAILLEARILAVADVVEAIASHRPYRPALGIEAALEEIEKNAGMLYDLEVVEACLRLFREKGFRFE